MASNVRTINESTWRLLARPHTNKAFQVPAWHYRHTYKWPPSREARTPRHVSDLRRSIFVLRNVIELLRFHSTNPIHVDLLRSMLPNYINVRVTANAKGLKVVYICIRILRITWMRCITYAMQPRTRRLMSHSASAAASVAPPLWSALLWSLSFVVINAIMIVVIYSDRASFVMSEKEEKLYQVFNALSPGEFKKILKIE